MARHIRYGVAVAALMCGLAGPALFADRQHPYRSAAFVCVEVTAIDHLAGPAFTMMREEATRIWLRQGIALTWKRPAPNGCVTTVPIVFDAEQLKSIANGKHRDALAVTVFSGRSRVVYVSVARAFQMLAEIREATTLPAEGERDLRGGLLIGRIVAHELGHVLLTTLAHSTSGLMRPVFGLRDVVASDDRMTALSEIETTRLAARFSLVPLESPTTALAQRER